MNDFLDSRRRPMFIWLMIFISHFAYSYHPTTQSSCSYLDLRSPSLGEVKNQGNISWCYAFTASDILKYGFDLDQRVSAADVALRFNNSLIGRLMDTIYFNGTPHETGFNKSALQQSIKEGVCPETAFPSENWVKVSQNHEEIIPMPKAMEEINQLFKRKAQFSSESLPFYFSFKHVDKDKFADLLKSKNIEKFYENLRQAACEPERLDLSKKYKVKMKIRGRRIFKHVNKVLTNGMIVGVDYDSRILRNRNHRGVKISELHTSSIVGRRWNSYANTCEYLIRDSKGPACLIYDENYECEQGNIWLTESRLYNSLTSIVFLENL